MTQLPPKQAKDQTTVTEELDASSMAAIRSVLVSEPEAFKAPKTAKSARRRKPTGTRPSAAPAPVMNDTKPPEKPAARPQRTAAQVEDDPDAAQRPAQVRGRLPGYRPTAKHVLLGCIVVLIALRPWLVIGLLILSTIMMIGVFLILGYDGFWRKAMGLAQWYARRRPSRAAILHQKLDRFAMKWDSVLDRFPEGSVDGLYLPDFGDLAQADSRHDAALERRLDKLRGSEG